MGTEIFKIDASWTEKLTIDENDRVSKILSPTVAWILTSWPPQMTISTSMTQTMSSMMTLSCNWRKGGGGGSNEDIEEDDKDQWEDDNDCAGGRSEDEEETGWGDQVH